MSEINEFLFAYDEFYHSNETSEMLPKALESS